VPPSSQEIDPSNVSAVGALGRESLWVNYYVSGGWVDDDVRIIYDATTGGTPASANALAAASEPGEYTLWAVVRDDRGGVDWIDVALHVR